MAEQIKAWELKMAILDATGDQELVHRLSAHGSSSGRYVDEPEIEEVQAIHSNDEVGTPLPGHDRPPVTTSARYLPQDEPPLPVRRTSSRLESQT